MQTDADNGDVFHPEPVPRRRVPAGKAMVVAMLALLLACLLDADGLHRTANRLSPGTEREVATFLTGSVLQPVSHTLRFNLPRKALVDALGHPDQHQITTTEHVKLAPPPTAAPQVPTPTTTPPPPPMRIPTATDPLRILVAGDSLSIHLGPSLTTLTKNLPVTVNQDSVEGTGLARPDVVDWPTTLAADMAKYHAEVVVLMFGGNDDQSLRTPTGWVSYTDLPAWQVEYEKRIALVMNTLIQANPTVTIVWIGLPAMRKAHLEQFRPIINGLVQREAAARPANVIYVDSGAALDGPDGSFQAYAVDPDGSRTNVREPDGIHFTQAGSNRIISQLVLPAFAKQRHLVP